MTATAVQDPVAQAKAVLRGDAQLEPKKALELARALMASSDFGYARRVLARARAADGVDAELARVLRREQALATSKDLDLPATRHERALQILADGEDLLRTDDQETLGIAGGILKRRWELDGNVRHLERALAFYRRGAELGIERDQGYTAINTAFLLDLLAGLDEEDAASSGATAPDVVPRREEADRIRREITRVLGGDADAKGWWHHATLAEAHLGLGEYDEARAALARAEAEPGARWEFESTVRQLATLARLKAHALGTLDQRRFEESEPGRVLMEFLGEDAEGALSAHLGKVGLALSGGGFRASLFHIGVLAKLAELDVLRRIEVLSCVSGGSIVGAHYYLKVRHLLEQKRDADVTRDDYVRLVHELADEFLTGVQTNVRCRTGVNPLTHLRTIVRPDHTTRIAGDNFERYIYSRVPDSGGDSARWLTRLFVHPKDAPKDFQPKRHNWLRRTKVPVLVLNATTLNTGHNWQFTASWMGEPPTGADNPVDRNDLLRRMYYDEAPVAHRQVRLGHAVAASACVPGLFNPITLAGLYGEFGREPLLMNVRLIDGGMHDNQGTASLIEQACSVMLVSDASGQMSTQSDPGASLPSVPLRSSSILMARVRAAQYDDLVARVRSSVVRGLMFIHLKKDLPLRVVDWTNTDDPYALRPPAGEGRATSYGIDVGIQQLLSDIRTDLDAFHDAEAFALMTSGYRMTESEFSHEMPDFPVSQEPPEQWRFLSVEPLMRADAPPEGREQLERLLRVSHDRFFKVLRLSPLARAGATVLGLAAAAALVYAFWRWRDQAILTVGTLGVIALAYGVMSFVSKRLGRLGFRETVARVGVELLMTVITPMVFGLHLLFSNRSYLARGRVLVDEATGAVTIGAPGRLARLRRFLSRNAKAPVPT